MNFVQVEFLVFFAVVFTLYWGVGHRRWQNALLVAGSAVFYGWVHPWFLTLLAGSAVLDYSVSRALGSATRYRRLLLAVSLVGDLGVLAWFKYFDFFIDSVAEAAGGLGLPLHPRSLGLILPVGISFYTFQTLGYTIDVYRGELKPRRDLLDYLVFVSFFPQLVAGPIERASRLLPQVESPRVFQWGMVRSGLALALWGAVKKVAVADSIAPYVDRVFLLNEPPAPVLWVAVIGFMVQIYADFSGYTDIARGTARMLGFELVENFRAPHLAVSTPEFWRRWHISLSYWIRDYLLAPLLGVVDRITVGRFVFAVTVTMVLVGLWHGARWNFVVFGLYHGLWMCVYVGMDRYLPSWHAGWRRIPAIGFHLFVVSTIGSLIFREPDISRVPGHLSRSFLTASPEAWTVAGALGGVVLAGVAVLVAGGVFADRIAPALQRSRYGTVVYTTLAGTAAVVLFVFRRDSQFDFIYFQF
jgi:alginate O-acetyltransferase complex protein AlgI